MTYLTLCAMLASRLNDDSVSLQQRKLAVVFKQYGVTEAAQQIVPGKTVTGMLAAKNKMRALEMVMSEIFKNAGVEYPKFSNMQVLLDFGRAIVAGLREEK